MLKKAYRTLVPERIRRRIAPLLQQTRNFNALARKYGQYASIRSRSCVDAAGEAIPWYTYPAIEFLGNLTTEPLSLFEYGSGNSTIWSAKRVSHIVSVEHDRAWYDQVKQKTPTAQNLEYIWSEQDCYEGQIARYQKEFDIIVIDGIRRPGCAQHALAHIKSFGGSIVILDNSDWYPALTGFITKELGWSRVDMSGFGPINDYTWTTSIWMNQESAGGIYRDRILHSIGAVRQQYDEDYEFSLRS
jgi:hypothetical protein